MQRGNRITARMSPRSSNTQRGGHPALTQRTVPINRQDQPPKDGNPDEEERSIFSDDLPSD